MWVPNLGARHVMLCCIFVVAMLGPLGLWAIPRAATQGGPDCCIGSRRKMMFIGLIAVAVAALCLAAILLGGIGPFRHICSVWAGP